jgi:hypothetical protein
VWKGHAISPAHCKITAPEAYMKTMNRNEITSLMWPGSTGMVASQWVNLCLLAIRGIAAYALIIQCLEAARAADALTVKEPGTQTAPAQMAAYTPKGCRMERYKAFARQAEMPAITVTNTTVLDVGGVVKTDLNRLGQLSVSENAALARQFGVPVEVINKVIQRATNNASPGAAQFAQDIRTAVIDYRFLQGEWGRYHPPAEGQQLKANALAALQTGDISKAWELYDGLQRPAPPGNLRVVAEP